MGGGASKYVDRSQKDTQDEEALGNVSISVVSNSLFKPRPSQNSTIIGMEKRFTRRWSFSGEDQFNLAALKLLNDLLQKETLSKKEQLISFETWLEDKSSACAINIQKKHVNAVSLSIEYQRALPDDSLILLDTYLNHLPDGFDAVARIKTCLDGHTQALKIFAEECDFVHHDVGHAFEIESRTMNQAKELNIWQAETPRNTFLRAITVFMIRLHDYKKNAEFVNAKSGESDEEITANCVATWLNMTLKLPHEAMATDEENCVRQIIQFMAHRIIVCGTTMIYSQKRTLDLIELLFVLEKAAADAHVPLASTANQNFIEHVNIITILTGQNDKNPAASLLNVLEQLKNPNTATVPLLKHYYGNMSVLNMFFSLPQLKAYYKRDVLQQHYDAQGFVPTVYDEHDFFEAVHQQAFLMMIVPHISMCLESDQSTPLRVFIDICRFNLDLDPTQFKEKFEKAFVDYNVAETMNALFFEKLGAEAAFSNSQEGGLTEMAKKNLPGMGVERAELVYSLIDPSVPLRDALHLKALQEFYDGLTPVNTKRLCKELMMTVILQAGAMKAREFGFYQLKLEEPIAVQVFSI